jgi:hypothetical protein
MEVATRSVKVSLEPVQEDGEVRFAEKGGGGGGSCVPQLGKRGKPMKMLLKLRDGYVKLMNDLSTGADLAGVSSVYGCTGADYPAGAMANSRLAREEQEREIMLQALEVQQAHSRQFAAAVA